MSVLTTIEGDVAKLAPIAVTVITSIEGSIKSAAGDTKKAVAVNVISNLAKLADSSGNATAEGIGGLVDTLVGVLNSVGLFKHAAAPTA